mmetsp:Transcript_4807/g.9553  ORF Transcript_4807/g.9553 Transcript_4807/m.9553 type:complete len:142 (+) Transcript_4807:88-513(+)
MESKEETRDTELLEIGSSSDYRQSLLVHPRTKPDIGPVQTNVSLINRLNAFLPEFKSSTERLEGALNENEPGIELPDDHEGEHVELDLACGMFDLKDEAAVEAAERNMRAGADAPSSATCSDEKKHEGDGTGAVHPGIQEL